MKNKDIVVKFIIFFLRTECVCQVSFAYETSPNNIIGTGRFCGGTVKSENTGNLKKNNLSGDPEFYSHTVKTVDIHNYSQNWTKSL